MNIVDGIIVKAIDGFYYVICEKVEYFCKSRKKFRFKEIEPKVGDNVSINIIDKDKKEGVIEKIYDRTTDFIRPQLSNVTQVFIVLSYKEPKINLELLNKLIINFEVLGVKICVVINKCDLYDEKSSIELNKLFEKFPYDVLFVSVKDNLNINCIKEKLSKNISCFCGPSGVGKSSLLNAIFDKNVMETSELSCKIKRGRHTTRFSQLIYLKDFDGYIADTPGFTSIEISKDINQYNLKNYFIDFYNYDNCKFRECNHITEHGCGVKHAVEIGEINKMRYDMYVKIYNKFKEKRR